MLLIFHNITYFLDKYPLFYYNNDMEKTHLKNMKTCSGLTIIELLISLVIGSFVVSGTYNLWLNHQKQVFIIKQKTDLRNHMILSSKKIRKTIVNAGFGLPLVRAINVNSDTLRTFSNINMLSSLLIADISSNSKFITVDDPSLFSIGSYLTISDNNSGEIHKIISKNRNEIGLDSGISKNFTVSISKAYPVIKESFYINRYTHSLINNINGVDRVILNNIYDFKPSIDNRTIYITVTCKYKNSLPLTFTISSIARNSI